MLKQDFNLELGVTQGELPRDAHGLDIPGIWNVVSQAVKDIRGWEVVEDLVISTFSFAKYLMWKDLVDRTDQLMQNPVVENLIDKHIAISIRNQLCRSIYSDKLCPEQFCPLSAILRNCRVITAAKEKISF